MSEMSAFLERDAHPAERESFATSGTKSDISANNASTRYRPCIDDTRIRLESDRMECCIRVDVETTTRNSPRGVSIELWKESMKRQLSQDCKRG